MTIRLLAAADRGVAVRILVDDLKLHRSTHTVASLSLHPNVDIRVFNPWNVRASVGGRAREFLWRFRKLDHRMHNKLLIGDRDQALFGGRNLAEEYFGLAHRYNYVDVDVLHRAVL
jgi:putative cardiolipin synthase